MVGLCLLLCAAVSQHHRRNLQRTFTRKDDPPYEVKGITQPLDHFNHLVGGDFTQRYLVNDSAWVAGGGAAKQMPIFVFTGAEGGDVEGTFYAFGSYFDMFMSLGGLVVFVEHRYFGKSYPFGGNTTEATLPDAAHVGHLSVEQGERDTVNVITKVRSMYSAWSCPVYTFGGSLGGTLAGLMRLRYPEHVQGAVVSSSPLLGYVNETGVGQYEWAARVTKTFEVLSQGCSAVVREGFSALGAAGVRDVAEVYNTCEGGSSVVSEGVFDMVSSVLQGSGEFAYPFPLSSIPRDCDAMASNIRTHGALSTFTSLLNVPNKPGCLNITSFIENQSSPDSRMWDYLACTEIIHPIGYNNKTDFFPPSPWSVASLESWCQDLYPSVRVSPTLVPQTWGLTPEMLPYLPSRTSHIMFTYGTADPWATQGVQSSLSSTIITIWVANGTHCADAEGSFPGDTPDMLRARAEQKAILSQWVTEHQQLLRSRL